MAGRRCLTRREAAEHIGLSLPAFDDWRRKGILPGPIPDTHRWDKKALDAALDKASGLNSDQKGSAFDDWKRRARESAGHQHDNETPR